MDRKKLIFSKKAIAVTLAGVTLTAAIPATPLKTTLESFMVVSAQENATSVESFTYSKLTGNTVEIEKYIGNDTKVIIPETIDGMAVTSIGSHAFYDNTSVESVTIPNGVTDIGYEAFYGCIGMTEVTISDTVTSIGEAAFRDCQSLETINIGNNLQTIGNKAFEGCLKVERITLPQTVTYIGDRAFFNCQSLLYLNIPDSVQYIGTRAFEMETGNADKSIPWYSQLKGEVYFGNIYYEYKGTMPENTTVTIKDGTTMIAPSAFYGMTNLVKVEMPDTVVSVGKKAFSDCTGLKEVEFSNSLVEIQSQVFQGCTSLTDVMLPESIAVIQDYAFRNCTSMEYINIPQATHYIAQTAFLKCENLLYIVFSENCDFDSLSVYRNEMIEKIFLDNNYQSNLLYSPSSIQFIVIKKEEDGKGLTEIPFADNFTGDVLVQDGINCPDTVRSSCITMDLIEDAGMYKVNTSDQAVVMKLPNPMMIGGKAYERVKSLSVLKNYEYIAPTCESEGRKCVWVSDDSQSFYLDEAGTIPYDFYEDGFIGFKEIIIPKVDHHYVDGKCEWCGNELSKVKLEGNSITLDGDIVVNYYMQLDESVLEDDGAVMRFTTENGKVKEVNVKDAKTDTTTVAGKTCYVFSCDMPAKEMNDTIEAQVILSDGSMSESYSYTVKQYADEIIENKDNNAEYTKAKELVKAMLVYGSYAQIYFEHNVDKLAFELSGSAEAQEVENVSAEDLKLYASTALKIEDSDNVTLAGINMSLLSKTTLRLFFKVEDGSNPKFLYNSNELNIRTTNNYCYVEIPGIRADELNKTFSITVVDGDTSKTVQYSPMTYAYNVLSREENDIRTPELKNLMKAMYIYNAKAVDYNQ